MNLIQMQHHLHKLFNVTILLNIASAFNVWFSKLGLK